ncbi:Uncharacterised protein [Cedecea neteri]|uniref:N-acetyltransferase domain-containing protein n=1 Tax=Cedecea neteri TaxID=158822 RepID=A0A2X3JDB8_9ENTR|nr:Uncharacterised protein [Cedecea neteri]
MSWARLMRYIGHWQALGYGYWARCLKNRVGVSWGRLVFQEVKRNLTPALEHPEAGWSLIPAVHGQGYAAEALSAVLNWADNNFSGPVCCIIDDDNQRSIGLAERFGFTFQHYVEYHGSKYECSFARTIANHAWPCSEVAVLLGRPPESIDKLF